MPRILSKEPKTFGKIPDPKYIPTDVNDTAGIPAYLQIGIGFQIMLRRNLSVQMFKLDLTCQWQNLNGFNY